MIPLNIKEHLEQAEIFSGKVTGFKRASGGCINHGGQLLTDSGSYFIKWNDRQKFPGMFEAEKLGLLLLEKTGCISTPHPVLTAETGIHSYIIMDYIEKGSPRHDYWEFLGKGLACIHRNTQSDFGLDHDNYIGSLPQKNTPHANWVDFFIEQRLLVQLNLGIKHNRVSNSVADQFDQLFKKLPDLFPEEPPALVHGDLWNGNMMVNKDGSPVLIDPAIYYGFREMDLSMARLFGGFSETFFQVYHDTYPLCNDYEIRTDLCNLYPLLVHVNLFGGGYLNSVLQILNRFQ